MNYIGTGKDARPATLAERRGALKAYVLRSLAIVVKQEFWESWSDASEDFGLTEEDLQRITDQISDELYRRAAKLPYIPSRVVLP